MMIERSYLDIDRNISPVELEANSTARNTGRPFDVPVLNILVACAWMSTVRFGRRRNFEIYAVREVVRLP
jgi:hypothetical protein